MTFLPRSFNGFDLRTSMRKNKFIQTFFFRLNKFVHPCPQYLFSASYPSINSKLTYFEPDCHITYFEPD